MIDGVIAVLIENSPEALPRVLSVLRRHRFQVVGLVVGDGGQRDAARALIAVRGGITSLDLVRRQIDRLAEVLQADAVRLSCSVAHETIRFNLDCSTESREDLVQLARAFCFSVIEPSAEAVDVGCESTHAVPMKAVAESQADGQRR